MSVESGGHGPEGSEAAKAFQNALDLLREKGASDIAKSKSVGESVEKTVASLPDAKSSEAIKAGIEERHRKEVAEKDEEIRLLKESLKNYKPEDSGK